MLAPGAPLSHGSADRLCEFWQCCKSPGNVAKMHALIKSFWEKVVHKFLTDTDARGLWTTLGEAQFPYLLSDKLKITVSTSQSLCEDSVRDSISSI